MSGERSSPSDQDHLPALAAADDAEYPYGPPPRSPVGEFLDQPLDAIVYQMHPALLGRRTDWDNDYPYGGAATVGGDTYQVGPPVLQRVSAGFGFAVEVVDRFYAAIQKKPD